MSSTALGVLGIVVLLVLLAIRLPVGIAMLVVGLCGVWYIIGLEPAMMLAVSEMFGSVTSYQLMIIPLFIFMGNLAGAAGLSQGLYDAAAAFIGRYRGGLASATIGGCAGFSAVSGSSIASAITMGQVALPQMRAYGYDAKLAGGAVAAGGTIGILIPPATGFVVYAILTEQSIGRLFMAGVVPGLLMTILFIATIFIWTHINPKLAPATDDLASKDKWWKLAAATPLAIVVLLTIGGIYTGIFTPTEASGIGALMVLAIAVATRSISLRTMGQVLLSSVRTTAMIYIIIVGAFVFAPFLSLTGMPGEVARFISSLGLGDYGTLLVILALFIVLGTFLEGFAMLVLVVPLVFPLITQLGFDPIWFGVLVVVTLEMGLITPPVGINVFIVKSLMPDTPMGTIFAGVLPFWFAMLVALACIVLIPDIALFLPNMMFE